eukprot:204679-Pelagomonas_calceolata.AAC.1
MHALVAFVFDVSSTVGLCGVKPTLNALHVHACRADVAAFVFDASSAESFRAAVNLMVQSSLSAPWCRCVLRTCVWVHSRGITLAPASCPVWVAANEDPFSELLAFLFDPPVVFACCVGRRCPPWQVSTLAGDSLPCVLVAAKEDLVMGAQLEKELAAVMAELQ